MTNLNFTNEGAEYSVFTSYDGESRPKIHKAGISVSSKGMAVEVLCSKITEHSLSKLKPLVSCDPDDALNIGRCP